MGGERDQVIDYGEKFNLRDLLDRPVERKPEEQRLDAGTESIAPDEAEPMPLPGSPYRAYSRVSVRPLPMLCFLLKGGGFKMLCYGNLESIDFKMPEAAGESPSLLLLFTGLNPYLIQLEGRNLLPVADALRRHGIAWVRECPAGRELRGDAETVITRITPKPVEI